jgi:RNA polymerase sigma-70 factor (ECF subfamily)
MVPHRQLAGNIPVPSRIQQVRTTKKTMPVQPVSSASALAAESDIDLVRRVADADQAAFEALMRRHNTRLFRVARAILRDDAEAEDALQDAYLDAYRHIRDFRGDAQPATWLTRIVVNQALMRLRRSKRGGVVVPFGTRHPDSQTGTEEDVADETTESPSSATLRAEIRRMLERRIDELPVAFRTVFVMRDVEDMTVAETADCLAIPAATVRTRLFRARALLRAALADDMDTAAGDVFAFAGGRCDRIVAGVLGRVRASSDDTPAAGV